LEENVDDFDEFSILNVESYSPMVLPSYSCETSSKKTNKLAQMVEMLEKPMDIFQSGIDNVAASIRQGNEIAKEELIIVDRGRPRCYSDSEVFYELVNMGIPLDMQLDAMLFLIKDPSK